MNCLLCINATELKMKLVFLKPAGKVAQEPGTIPAIPAPGWAGITSCKVALDESPVPPAWTKSEGWLILFLEVAQQRMWYGSFPQAILPSQSVLVHIPSTTVRALLADRKPVQVYNVWELSLSVTEASRINMTSCLQNCLESTQAFGQNFPFPGPT